MPSHRPSDPRQHRLRVRWRDRQCNKQHLLSTHPRANNSTLSPFAPLNPKPNHTPLTCLLALSIAFFSAKSPLWPPSCFFFFFFFTPTNLIISSSPSLPLVCKITAVHTPCHPLSKPRLSSLAPKTWARHPLLCDTAKALSTRLRSRPPWALVSWPSAWSTVTPILLCASRSGTRVCALHCICCFRLICRVPLFLVSFVWSWPWLPLLASKSRNFA